MEQVTHTTAKVFCVKRLNTDLNFFHYSSQFKHMHAISARSVIVTHIPLWFLDKTRAKEIESPTTTFGRADGFTQEGFQKKLPERQSIILKLNLSRPRKQIFIFLKIPRVNKYFLYLIPVFFLFIFVATKLHLFVDLNRLNLVWGVNILLC